MESYLSKWRILMKWFLTEIFDVLADYFEIITNMENAFTVTKSKLQLCCWNFLYRT